MSKLQDQFRAAYIELQKKGSEPDIVTGFLLLRILKLEERIERLERVIKPKCVEAEE